MTPLQIRAPRSDEFARLAQLFTFYPYKTAQQVIQGLDRQRLEQFYAQGLRRGLNGNLPYWVVESDREILALAGLVEDNWHSRVYGLKMGKVQPWLNTLQPEHGPVLMEAVEAQASQEGYQHLSVRVDGADFANLHHFESADWRLVDVSLKFSKSMLVQTPPRFEMVVDNEMAVGIADQSDFGWIERLAATTHSATHFLNDPHLPVEKTNELFGQWVRRCIEKLAYRIYTLKSRSGEGCGFVIYLRNPIFTEAVGPNPLILDFVLLDPSVRGKGLGPLFIEETLRREGEQAFDYCELRTSAHNLSAVCCYEKLGFLCCASDFVLHKAYG